MNISENWPNLIQINEKATEKLSQHNWTIDSWNCEIVKLSASDLYEKTFSVEVF